MYTNLVVEGDLDLFVLEKILTELGINITNVYGKSGRSYIEGKIRAYNEAAKFDNWIVLIDLDNDDCAPELITKLLPKASSKMCFRIAVREIESWVLGDSDSFKKFFSVNAARIPALPENEVDSKRALLKCIKSSRSSSIKKDMLPSDGSLANVGKLYNSKMAEFIRNHWRPKEAAKHCNSLKRAISAFKQLKKQH